MSNFIIRNNYQSVERKKTRKHKHGTFHTLILELWDYFCFFLVVQDLKMGGKTFFFFQLRQTIRLHVELLSQFGSFIHCYKYKTFISLRKNRSHLITDRHTVVNYLDKNPFISNNYSHFNVTGRFLNTLWPGGALKNTTVTIQSNLLLRFVVRI